MSCVGKHFFLQGLFQQKEKENPVQCQILTFNLCNGIHFKCTEINFKHVKFAKNPPKFLRKLLLVKGIKKDVKKCYLSRDFV